MSKLPDHSLKTNVRKSLSAFGVTPSSSILVGVSGGQDSMVLLHILHSLGFKVTAGHVNFNLRGAESINDALLVKQWSLDLGIPHHQLSHDTYTYAKGNHLNIQSAAREIRYTWWKELVHSHEFEFVATAHHLNDTIETALLNLLRGTGIKGLKGIPPVRDYFIRPLIESSLLEIQAYAVEFKIPFRTDESNHSDAYQRNKVRHHLLPLLEELNPGFMASMKHTLHRVNVEWEAWEFAYQEWISSDIEVRDGGFMINGGVHHLAFKLRWLEEKGLPWSLTSDFINSPNALSGQVLKYKNFKLLRTSTGHFLEEWQPVADYIIDKPGHHMLGDFEIHIDEIPKEAYLPGPDRMTTYVNADVIRWPLHIRNFEPGDRFQPFGMNGKSKKIQDYLVDQKLEMHEKSRQLVLTNEEHIIWVIGMRLDERARVTENPKGIYRLTYVLVRED